MNVLVVLAAVVLVDLDLTQVIMVVLEYLEPAVAVAVVAIGSTGGAGGSVLLSLDTLKLNYYV